MDMIYWRSDGSFISKDELKNSLCEIMTKDEWIIDGNYGSTMEMRLEKCDTVFFLDYPTEVCLAGVRARKGKPRSDMPFNSPDDADEEFVDFIKNYNEISRPKVISLLEGCIGKKVYIFSSRDEADLFLTLLNK